MRNSLKISILILLFINILFTNIYSKELNDSLKVDSSYIKIIQNLTVERIILVGNDKTEDEVIIRELQTKEGEKFNLEFLENDVKRLYNLGLFNRVDVLPAPISSSKINLVFEFEEAIYFLPIPQGGVKEGSLKKIWGGINFLWRNFRGKNETLGLSFGVGYEPFISANYLNPWLFGNNHFFFSTNFKLSRTYPRSFGNSDSTSVIFNKNEVPTYKMDDFQAYLKIGKFIGINSSISSVLQVNAISTSEYQPGRTISENGKDFVPSFGFDFTYDSRDYNKFALNGSYYNLNLFRYGIFDKSVDINKFRIDIRKYLPVKIHKDYSVIFAARFNSVLSFGGGVLPVYLQESMGYDNLIRGWDNYVFLGEDKLFNSIEVRIPLIKPFYIKGKDHFIINKLPIAKNFSYRYGAYLSLFFDMGGVWSRKEAIKNVEFKNGFGAGLNFLLPFDFIGRVDLGFKKVPEKDRFKEQIIFALDSSF